MEKGYILYYRQASLLTLKSPIQLIAQQIIKMLLILNGLVQALAASAKLM